MTERVDAARVIVTTRDGRVLVTNASDPSPAGTPGAVGPLTFPGTTLNDRDRSMPAPFRAGALRALFEQTGWTLHLQPGARYVAAVRAKAHAPDPVAIGERLTPAGRWVTPEYNQVRLDTRYFLTVIDRDPPLPKAAPKAPNVRWVAPAELLHRFRRLEVVLSFPVRLIMEALSLGPEHAARRLPALPGARGEELLDFEPVFGIRQLPLRTPTLPPATTTSAYVVGQENLLIVDPAAHEPDERDKLMSLLNDLSVRGSSVTAVVLTHHHPDHIGAATWVAEQLRIPVWAHRWTAKHLSGRIPISRTLAEGDLLDLEDDGAGRDFCVEVLFTPGHAPGHICLVDRRDGARTLIVGDMVASTGTILIDPPEGDMGAYLAQLERLNRFPDAVLLPAHGPPIVDGNGRLAQYIAHRRMREAKVLRALETTGGGTPADLVKIAYDETPPRLHTLAARSCLAHLIKLEKDGRAVRTDDRFQKKRSKT